MLLPFHYIFIFPSPLNSETCPGKGWGWGGGEPWCHGKSLLRVRHQCIDLAEVAVVDLCDMG